MTFAIFDHPLTIVTLFTKYRRHKIHDTFSPWGFDVIYGRPLTLKPCKQKNGRF